MRKLSVSTLVSLDGVIQDPGGFGETEDGGWANPYFTADAEQEALRHLRDSDYFLVGRVTYELLRGAWADIKGGAYLDRMNQIPSRGAGRHRPPPGPFPSAITPAGPRDRGSCEGKGADDPHSSCTK